MEDFNTKVVFTVSAEDSEDAKQIIEWYLTLAQELIDERQYHSNFPDWIILSSKEVVPAPLEFTR
ncbi:MAG TPA: hypothetical protein VJ208_01400 [Candidatus Nanoarchaeia archaeon]|nr:hypothetical protein [Candidatus Nanoarchaeia archaeon]